MKTLLQISLFFVSLSVFSQINEDFSDGDFTSNPTWTGTTADYIINTNLELQTNLTVGATSFLALPHGMANLDNKEWRFRIRQTFSPSASNFGRVYLSAIGSDPTTNPDGYYLQFGEALSADAVRLFVQVGGLTLQICSGTSGAIANSFHFGVKITRDAAGLWSLSTDATGGTNYSFQSSGNDGLQLAGTHFIWQCTYTSSNANKFFLDDIFVGNIVVDAYAPILLSATAVSSTEIDALFNEPLDPIRAQDAGNYSLQPLNIIVSAVQNTANPNSVRITLTNPLTNGNNSTLFADNMMDLLGNDTTIQSQNFFYLVPENPLPGDVIINEVFPDPSPVVGLPELEFVEIYNRSTKYFDTRNWKIGDASGDGTIATSIFAPGQYLVVCATASVPSFSGAIGVTGFPSLNNTSDDVVLKDSNGVVLDQISYTDNWYRDAVKKSGGYTLERSNPTLICSSSQNWKASNDPTGGTPGIQNSIFDNSPDTQSPSLMEAVVTIPNALLLRFSEPMDSAVLASATSVVSANFTETNRLISDSQPQEMTLTFSPDFDVSTVYEIELLGVADCAGNSTNVSIDFLLPAKPTIGSVRINEILFNPVTGGSDYVEIFNTTNEIYDVFGWKLGNIASDTIANLKTINTHFFLYPNEWLVFSNDTANVKNNYPLHEVGQFVQTDLPNYGNDSGTVILIADSVVLDHVSYSSDWHFALLDDDDGKALERVNVFDESNNNDNWHTAAESVQFGTPGKANSQFVPVVKSETFTLTSKVVSPDNDGFEDFLQIRYQMAQPDLLITAKVFDEYGRQIKALKENEYVGTEGVFTWDGLNDDSQKASIGQYILVFEVFQPNGGLIFVEKLTCVLAGKI